MNRTILSLLVAFSLPCRAADKPAAPPAKPAKPAETAPAPPAADAPSLPKEVLDFHGKISGKIESVSAGGEEIKVKVTEATGDAEKNKAPNPGALAGMTITVTPLEKKQPDGTKKLDAAAVAWMKGTKPGDAVSLEIRASSKGVVFRLLKVPSAGG